MQDVLKDYSPRDIYNADETGLFYQLLPSKTLAFKGEKCMGGKKSKNRLTVLMTANMDGSDKRKLLLIGKSLKPRCFKGVKHIPVEYTANKKAWMRSELFEKFVREFDKEMAFQKRNVALIIDNCPAHPLTCMNGLTAVTVIFLPPNTTSHTQPMDAGVIKNLKHHYRQLFLNKVLISMESEDVFSIDVLGAIYLLKQAWDMVLPQTIIHCFHHAGFQLQGDRKGQQPAVEAEHVDVVTEVTLEGSLELVCEQLKSYAMCPEDLTVLEYINIDEHVNVAEQTLDEDIVASVFGKDDVQIIDEELSSDDEQLQNAQSEVKLMDAVKAVDTLQLYLDQNDINQNLTNCLHCPQ